MNPSSTIPALLGGNPVRPQGPPDWPLPDEDVQRALEVAYRDGSWGRYSGPAVERLEARLAALQEVPFVLTCGSGTFAVELALRALKVGPGDEVLLAGYDYPGNFLTIHALGAQPVLVEVAADNWNLDPDQLAAAVSAKTRALIVSHLHGGLVPMRVVMEIAARHGLKVVEDAAQAPGAVIQGRPAGSWGDVGILSFGGSKLLSAGRGGALVTNQADVHQRARVHMNRGNLLCPLSELQAAVLVPQLDKLPARNACRAANIGRLMEGLRGVPGLRGFDNRCPESSPVFYKAGFQFDAEAYGLLRERFVAAVRAEGVALDAGFRAFHVGRSASRFRAAGSLAEAERAHHGTVILHHPVLLGTEQDIDEVVTAVRKVHAAAEELRG